MKTIKPFIDSGWFTVPLKGQLKRLENGKKSIPQFEKDWNIKYAKACNIEATEIGGVITGAVSNIIAIDCDSQDTYNLFSSLDPSYTSHFVSKGKPEGGGTIIYSYPNVSEDVAQLESFQVHDEHLSLDFYSDNGFVYLPTNNNKSKEPWLAETVEDLPSIKPAPSLVLALLQSLHKAYQQVKLAKSNMVEQEPIQHKINFLAPQLELMLAKGQFLPSIFKIITPKDFRSLPQYVKFGYLHPENIPDGRGSEYLSKVSAILGADPSVSQDLYIKTMKFINDSWAEPIPQVRFTSTILEPMLESQATIDGKVIWKFDENWKAQGMTFTTKFGDLAEVFFDDIRATYYLVNHGSNLVKSYQKDNDIYSYIETVGVDVPVRKSFKLFLPLIRTTMQPAMPFGFYNKDEYTRAFNMFQQTPELRILNDPNPYSAMYTKPTHILSFFKSLIPDNLMRNFLLQFLKRKLTTFGYSPVILFFLGVQGSGKDTLVNILAKILGEPYIGKPATKEFLEQFNGWIVDTYFTQLDEYGNQLSKFTDKQEALGKIKALSGKSNIQVRLMRTDGFSYNHNTTFILTANANPLLLEDGDRRLAFFDTPNVLKNETWVTKAGGITRAMEAINREVKDFCYYLATEVGDLHPDEYVSPPATDRKHELISKQLPAGQRIGYYLKYGMFNELYNLAKEYEMTEIFNYSNEGRLYEESLFDLYALITDGHGVKRGLTSALRDVGYEKIPTTRNGVKAYYFYVEVLKHFEIPSEGFQNVEDQSPNL